MEIGHEYHLEFEALQIKKNNLFNLLNGFNTVYLDSGRNANYELSALLSGKEILVPCYACESVIVSFRKDVKVTYYEILKDFSINLPDLESKITANTKAIYVMSYFGKPLSDNVLDKLLYLKEKYNLILIEDSTHSVMTNPNVIGDYCVCSVRKWFPVADGGAIYSKLPLDFIDTPNLPIKPVTQKPYAMILKTLYLRGQVDERDFYEKIFADTEIDFDVQNKTYLMNDLSRFFIECFDLDEIRTIRKRNHSVLMQNINHKDMLPVYDTIEDSVPFCFLLYVENRDKVREYLFSKNIRPSVFWWTEKTELRKFEISNYISRHILCLHCDHRYSVEDMLYVANMINSYKE